ncbi:hypothetical protein TEA_016899 [Camellia sinensis var. sinensis]|uniref:Uncharacterized protein n=1 Tax=Camellia sinensis var. sinensis TaxID=542762 RepID=A0A4S4EFT8_CAMSN|nr:hypothetical protein TEA_016899 [Camellia sinensis var. sinensis]
MSIAFSYTLVGLIVVLEIVALITVLQIKTLRKKLGFGGCNGLGCLGFYLLVFNSWFKKHTSKVCLFILHKRESCSSVDSEEFEPEPLVDSGVAHRQDNSEMKTGLEEAHRGWFNSGVDLLDIENKNGDFSNPWGLLQSMEALHRNQGMMMDRTIGSFFIPAASLSTCDIISVIFWVPVYDRVIIPIVRKFTGREKGFIELQRMGIGLFILVLCMVSAALVEMKRLALAQALGLVDENVPIPLSITWQIPQYFLFGAAEVFTFIGQLEFFYEQSPDGMRSLFAALSLLTTSMGSYLSSFILTVVTSRSTETRMRMLAKGWDLGVGEDLEAFVMTFELHFELSNCSSMIAGHASLQVAPLRHYWQLSFPLVLRFEYE